MKNFKNYFLVLMVLALSACGGTKQDENTVTETPEVKEEAPVIKEDWSLITVTGTVTAINKETRNITLMGEKGNLVTVKADESVERFDEIAEGDEISFDYLVYVMAEFRDPTPEEIAKPLEIMVDAAKAPKDLAPAGATSTIMKGVVTIEALNRPFMLGTVRGPRGNYMTLPMKDAAFMETLHIGQVLVLTYAEATAISLTKL